MKGQVFSLDFLLSLALVFLATGLLLRAAELSSYDKKDEQTFSEMTSVAENAAILLAANPRINCMVDTIDEKLVNCIDLALLTNANARNNLGIPTGYGFRVSGLSSQIASGNQENKDFIEAKRTVLLHNGVITKSEYNTTFRNTPLSVVTIRVWQE